MSNQENITLSFPEEEESIAIFILEDLIKEYNHRVIESPSHRKLFPLSLQPLQGASSDEITMANTPTIRAMTKEEVDKMRADQLHAEDWFRLKKIFADQILPVGILANTQNVADGAKLASVINELGLTGKVRYNTVGGKTYVIIKGYAGDRTFLKGTRYLNTHPEIARFGLAKVSFKDSLKTGFKASLFVYGAIKITEAAQLCMPDGQGYAGVPGFFARLGTDIPKLAIGSTISAAAGGTVVALGLPVAAGAGVVLAVGIGVGIGLEYLDQKLGFSEKLTEAANTMWKNLKSWWNTPAASTNQTAVSMNSNLLEGFTCGPPGPLYRNPRITHQDGYQLYIT